MRGVTIRASIDGDIRNGIRMSAGDPRTWRALAEAVRLVEDGAGRGEIREAMTGILA